MALTDTISALFRRNRDAEATTSEETRELMDARKSQGGGLGDKFKGADGRQDTIDQCRQMYNTDPRAQAIIQTLARDAVANGFTLETEDGRAKEIIEDLVARLNLHGALADWARLCYRDGDVMIELGVNTQREIADVTVKPIKHMTRYSNAFDRFDDPDRAFYYRPPNAFGGMGFGESEPKDDEVIWFSEWQIVHGRWNHDPGSKYGRPLLAASILAWKRIREGELDIAIRRKTRAGVKFAHILRGTDEAGLQAYKAANKAAIDDPFAAVADFFIANDGDIKLLSGDANLDQVDDLRLHLDSFFLSSPVPRTVIGYGQDINFSVVEHQKEQYNETLEEVRSWIVENFIRPIIERQWLLAGILPENIAYEIKWPTKENLTPEGLEMIAKALTALKAAQLPEETVATIIARYLPGIEPEELIRDEEAADDEAARLAQIAQQLGQQIAQQNNPPPPPEEGQPPEATETWRQFTKAWHVSQRDTVRG